MENLYNVEEYEQILGESIKALRLQKNIDQKTLCARAGISINALRHLEQGEGASVKTLIRVARALGRQDWLMTVAPKVTVNPLYMVRNQPERQRARKKKKQDG